MGESLLVVGDEEAVKVHIHTKDTKAVLAYARTLGTVSRVKIDDIDAQHREFSAKGGPAAAAIAIVAVVPGPGLEKIFKSLGAAAIVPGGQTMNPSAQEILQAIRLANARFIIVLPNNKNVILTAQQARTLGNARNIAVLPTETVPQGVAALLAFNPQAGVDPNLAAMERARRNVRTGEVTRASRNAVIERIRITQGQAMGFWDDALATVDAEPAAALRNLLEKADVQKGAAITIYYGEGVAEREAQEVALWAKQRFPDAEIEAVGGGQPHYDYLVSLE